MTEAADAFETEAGATTLDDFEETPGVIAPRRHLSNSQVGAMTNCSMIYYWRYVRGVRAHSSSAMTFGSSVHKGLEHNFRQKIYSHRDEPVSVVTDVFRQTWKDAAGETVFDVQKGEDPDQMVDEGVALLSKYQEEAAPNIQPLHVEVRSSLRLPGISQEIMGYIDVIDDQEIIIDHKTSRKTPDPLMLAKDLQLTGYKMSYRQQYGHNPKGLRYDYLVRKTSKKTGFWTEIHPIAVTRNEMHERMLISTYMTAVKEIEANLFIMNPRYFGCSPIGCGFWSRCMGKVLANERLDFLDDIRERQIAAYHKLMEGPGKK